MPPARVRSPRLVIAPALLLVSGACVAGGLPSAVGLHALPGTRIRPHCPAEAQYPGITGGNGCDSVTEAWSGAAFDAGGNRLLINGGGHADWAGNEVYELDLDTITMRRLNAPSHPLRDGCVAANNGTYADGRPVSRHTYNHLAYLEAQGLLLLFGGSLWYCGFFGRDTWTYDPATDTWTARSDADAPRADYGLSIVRDPATGLVWARDSLNVYAYDPVAHRWQRRSGTGDLALSNARSGVFDATRGRYFLYTTAARTLHHYDVRASSGLLTLVSRPAPTCTFMDRDGAGWAYDPRADRLVAWNGGDTVHLLDPETATCTSVQFPGGPAAHPQGTFGRFAYAPRDDVFVTCNDIDADCRILRLRPGDGLYSDGFE